MPLVVDTNILISGLLRDGATRSVLLAPGRRLLVPAYALDEVERHVPGLAQRMGAEEKRVRSILDHLTDEVEVAALGTYEDRLPAAREAVADIDPDDAPFVALALARDCRLWTDDKALQKQDAAPVVTTSDLLAGD